METSIRSNKIYVIQSLDSKETQTGEELVWDSLHSAFPPEGLGLAFLKAKDRESFFGAMKFILGECEQQKPRPYPIIHLETHGLKSKHGVLLLPSREYITWEELAECMRRINVECRNNLMLVTALCHGLHAITSLRLSEPAPFLIAVGPETAVSVGEIADGFPGFYQELLATNDLDKAMKKLSNKFTLFMSDKMFVRAFSHNLSSGVAGGLAGKEVTRSTFCRMRDRFLLADHPANLGRFDFDFDLLWDRATRVIK